MNPQQDPNQPQQPPMPDQAAPVPTPEPLQQPVEQAMPNNQPPVAPNVQPDQTQAPPQQPIPQPIDQQQMQPPAQQPMQPQPMTQPAGPAQTAPGTAGPLLYLGGMTIVSDKATATAFFDGQTLSVTTNDGRVLQQIPAQQIVKFVPWGYYVRIKGPNGSFVLYASTQNPILSNFLSNFGIGMYAGKKKRQQVGLQAMLDQLKAAGVKKGWF